MADTKKSAAQQRKEHFQMVQEEAESRRNEVRDSFLASRGLLNRLETPDDAEVAQVKDGGTQSSEGVTSQTATTTDGADSGPKKSGENKEGAASTNKTTDPRK